MTFLFKSYGMILKNGTITIVWLVVTQTFIRSSHFEHIRLLSQITSYWQKDQSTEQKGRPVLMSWYIPLVTLSSHPTPMHFIVLLPLFSRLILGHLFFHITYPYEWLELKNLGL